MCHTYEYGDAGQGLDERRQSQQMFPPAGVGVSGAGPPVVTADRLQGLVLLQQAGQHLYEGGEVASLCIRASSV